MSTDGTLQPSQSSQLNQDGNVIETIQSLIVAFVLAMTFRGFVTEGFVIPTGSMAPTLLGQHVLAHSDQTGITFPIGVDQATSNFVHVGESIADPMLGPAIRGPGSSQGDLRHRMGDRILVLKCLYPFEEPKRFDVVVFKNPTDPVGDTSNYIKRLIGLPDEQIWLADGDVFARQGNDKDFKIQRKPEHVQRAVWQMVHHSDYVPIEPQKLIQHYDGPPWVGDHWDTTGRAYRCDTAQPTVLTWDNSRRAIDDWASYNVIEYQRRRIEFFPVSDVRISAGIDAQQPGWKTTLELESRSHLFEFSLENTKPGIALATLRMRPLQPTGGDAPVEAQAEVAIPKLGRVVNVEFWHADQSMQLYIDGRLAMDPLNYEWSPTERLQFATGDWETQKPAELIKRPAQPPQLRWRFEGSPLTLHRVRVDRDLFYRPEQLSPGPPQQRNQPYLSGAAFGTNPDDSPRHSQLGPNQFMMCGDNSQMSLDSRLWGSPHPLVAAQIDDSPFIVNRKLLLGKAWVVYFPAPFSITDGGMPVVPDFGRLRFIR